MEAQHLFINLNLKAFTPPDLITGWYNLDTNRVVGSLKNRLGLECPRVAASNWEIIAEFISLNHLTPFNITYMTADLVTAPFLHTGSVRGPNRALMTDINLVSPDTIDQLEEFEFQRILTKARVTEVIDGDTVVIAFILEPDQFNVCHWARRNKKMTQVFSALSCDCQKKDSPGILMKLRIRLFGIDAAESSTEAGQAAKSWLKAQLVPLHNIIWIQLMGTEARGRTLGNLYTNEACTNCLNTALLKYDDPQYGRLAVPYYGATKDKAFHGTTERGSPMNVVKPTKPVRLETR